MKSLYIKTEDKRLNDLKKIKSSEIVYIWGNGSYSKTISEYLRETGGFNGRLIKIVDDEYLESENSDTISFSSFLKNQSFSYPIVFGFYNYKSILQKKEKWRNKFHHMYDFHLTTVNGKLLRWDPKKAKSLEQDYATTYNLLSDERSRCLMQSYLNAAIAGDFHQLFSEFYTPNAYFNETTNYLDITTLIDCGAYNGDSIHDFISEFPDYKKIIAIEPDPSNLIVLRRREKRENIRFLEIQNKGVSSKSDTLRFKANGKSDSFLDSSGNIEIHVVTIDEIVSSRNDDPGQMFLKMDIEGGELEALHGAVHLITERTPVLAICVYHKEMDLIEIPKFIHEVSGSNTYDYHLGFHGLDLAELVFYAVSRRLTKNNNP